MSKRAAETLCVSYQAQYGIELGIARLCHTYGPTMIDGDDRAASSFLRDAALGRKIVLHSDGSTVRSYLYIFDAVRAILFILCKGQGGQAYNVAPDDSISIKQFAEFCAKHSGQALDFQPKNEGSFKIIRQVLDNSRLHELGWHALTNISDGVRKTIEILQHG